MTARIAVIHEVLSWISKSKRLYQFSHKSYNLAITKAKDQIRPELKHLDPEITLELTSSFRTITVPSLFAPRVMMGIITAKINEKEDFL